MPVAQTDDYKVLDIKTLGKDRDVEARQMLERVAKQVQPIMRKRQWTVRKLSEFIPRSPNLLGLNVNRYRWARRAFHCVCWGNWVQACRATTAAEFLLLLSASVQHTQHAQEGCPQQRC
jgi:hypothetical protein